MEKRKKRGNSLCVRIGGNGDVPGVVRGQQIREQSAELHLSDQIVRAPFANGLALLGLVARVFEEAADHESRVFHTPSEGLPAPCQLLLAKKTYGQTAASSPFASRVASW